MVHLAGRLIGWLEDMGKAEGTGRGVAVGSLSPRGAVFCGLAGCCGDRRYG